MIGTNNLRYGKDQILCDFRDIEKIKTISANYMVASGLSPDIERRDQRPDHAKNLLRFATKLQESLKEFNHDMMDFSFLLRVGFNVGEVVSGIIGTQKLLYDIWGDAVNISSRMYSTGKVGYIQTTQKTADLIKTVDDEFREKPEFEWEKLDPTFVKGKGMMEVCRLKQD